MSSGSPIRTTTLQPIKNILEFITASDDDPDTYGTQLKEQAKVIEIPIKERILIVPLYARELRDFCSSQLDG